MDVSWGTEGKTQLVYFGTPYYANSGVQVALILMYSYLLHGIWKRCKWAEVLASLGSASHALRGFSSYSSSIIFKCYLKIYFPFFVKLVNSRKKYRRQKLFCLLALGIKVQGWLLQNWGLLLSAVLPKWLVHIYKI